MNAIDDLPSFRKSYWDAAMNEQKEGGEPNEEAKKIKGKEKSENTKAQKKKKIMPKQQQGPQGTSLILLE